MLNKYIVVAGLAALLSGCGAPRGLNHTVTPAEDPYSKARVSQAEEALGNSIAMLPTGATQSFLIAGATTEITMEDNYTSALGEDCKMLRIRGDMGLSKKAAVCRNPSGQWRYLPPLS